MKVLVTGREGQVVRSLLERAGERGELDIVALGRPELDLALPGSGRDAVLAVRPDVVINAAAYTAVDQAEDEPEQAFRANGEAPWEIAMAARSIGAKVIQISTDYVFDGGSAEPFAEQAATNPISVYGKSKLLGEQRVRDGNPDDHLIVRTAWVYSPFGRNFVKTMMSLAATRDEVSVVVDQIGNPTSALDIADGLIEVLGRWSRGGREGLGKTFHLAGSGTTTWHGLASHIFETCERLGLPSAKALPIPTAAYPTKAVRPANSMLDSERFALVFGYHAPDWRLSATQVVHRLATG
jgi:dTDP-4-dehydrorhamnose reductase